MNSKILKDPSVIRLLLLLLFCVAVILFCLTEESKESNKTCLKRMLLCNFNNVSNGSLVFHEGCAIVCNMSDEVFYGYMSGSGVKVDEVYFSGGTIISKTV